MATCIKSNCNEPGDYLFRSTPFCSDHYCAKVHSTFCKAFPKRLPKGSLTHLDQGLPSDAYCIKVLQRQAIWSETSITASFVTISSTLLPYMHISPLSDYFITLVSAANEHGCICLSDTSERIAILALWLMFTGGGHLLPLLAQKFTNMTETCTVSRPTSRLSSNDLLSVLKLKELPYNNNMSADELGLSSHKIYRKFQRFLHTSLKEDSLAYCRNIMSTIDFLTTNAEVSCALCCASCSVSICPSCEKWFENLNQS
ncbi:hypothetical protein PCE1_001998 [Barthelona sp. PCE]